MAQLKGKTYLERRTFLSDDKTDTSSVVSSVRRFDFGGMEATFRISTRGEHGFDIWCSPDSPDSLKATTSKIDSLMEHLRDFKVAITKAAKEAPKSEGNSPTSRG